MFYIYYTLTCAPGQRLAFAIIKVRSKSIGNTETAEKGKETRMVHGCCISSSHIAIKAHPYHLIEK